MLLQDGIELQSFVDHFSQRYDVKYFIECLKSNVLISHHNVRERERERERERHWVLLAKQWLMTGS